MTPAPRQIGLRVDVDFGIGLQRGVPFLLDLFRRHGVHATFYVTMGPDGFAKHANRLGSASYRARIRRMRPWTMLRRFGPVYLARQAAGFAGTVGGSHPDVIRRAIAEGHEVGVHGYDHYWWAEHVFDSDGEGLQNDMDHALRLFQECTGHQASAWASPNWRCASHSLRLVDERGFSYGADTRGRSPYRPMTGGFIARMPQLPISLPCLHEIADYLQTEDDRSIADEFLRSIKPGYNVWCVHDYYEGLLRRELFTHVFESLVVDGWSIVPMVALAAAVPAVVDVCEIVRGRVRGGRGEVSCQGPPVAVGA
jgi:undecaprenyl phosphate-alpha-L-ara4FN deformylase